MNKDFTKVYIIESPGPKDIIVDRREGYALGETLRLGRIKNKYFEAVNLQMLELALGIISKDIKNEGHRYSGIHFSMHGNESGIQLTDGKMLDWRDLFVVLKVNLIDVIGYKTNNAVPPLTICPIFLMFSTCKGFAAKAMKTFDTVPPYMTLVGPTEEVDWADSLLAYSTYYHNLIYKNSSTLDAVARMNQSAGLTDIFKVDNAEGLALRN